MDSLRVRRDISKLVQIHEDQPAYGKMKQEDCKDESENMDEGEDPTEESGYTHSDSSDDENDIEQSVLNDMYRLERSFNGISRRYRLMNRIGEGTFSTVYKAEDRHYYNYLNTWDCEEKENMPEETSATTANAKKRLKDSSSKPQDRKPHYVAIKKIYVTSSPARIMNELDLLHDLRHVPENIAPLITAFRDRDQVIAILPYFRHQDFRAYFRIMNVADMRIYCRSLFTAMTAVHAQGILHRDIKPTNFLYEPNRKRGVLVDFGLAEREGTDVTPCLCQFPPKERFERFLNSAWQKGDKTAGIPKVDERNSRRANRAGTRGFRAPEVLFKCTAQTTKIDVWSAGIVLLTLICKRFPFFNSADDIDAVIELTTVFGRKRMQKCALQHGEVFETNIPTIGDDGFSFEKIINWSLNRPTRDAKGEKTRLHGDEILPCQFLEACLALDPDKRITAREALMHPFLALHGDEKDYGNVMDVLTR